MMARAANIREANSTWNIWEPNPQRTFERQTRHGNFREPNPQSHQQYDGIERPPLWRGQVNRHQGSMVKTPIVAGAGQQTPRPNKTPNVAGASQRTLDPLERPPLWRGRVNRRQGSIWKTPIVAKRQTQHGNIGRQTRKAIMNMVARQVPGDKGHKTSGEKHSPCCTIVRHRRGFDIVSCCGYPRGPPPATAEK